MNLITHSDCPDRPHLRPHEPRGQPAFTQLLIDSVAPKKLGRLKQEAGPIQGFKALTALRGESFSK